MAKRLGNVTTVQGMREADVSPAALRHFVFNTHYRKELNLSDDALEASINAVRRVGDFADRLAAATGGTPELAAAADTAVAEVRGRAVRGPERAERAGWAVHVHPSGERPARPARIGRRGSWPGSAGVRAHQRRAGHRCRTGKSTTRRWLRGSRSGCRRAARRAERRDFAEADRIRAELVGKGIAIEDAGGRTTLEAGPVEAGFGPDA